MAGPALTVGATFTVIANGADGPRLPQPLLAVTVTFPLADEAEKSTVMLFWFIGPTGLTFNAGAKFHE